MCYYRSQFCVLNAERVGSKARATARRCTMLVPLFVQQQATMGFTFSQCFLAGSKEYQNDQPNVNTSHNSNQSGCRTQGNCRVSSKSRRRGGLIPSLLPLLEGRSFFLWTAVIMRYVESGTDPTHTTDGSALPTPLPCGSGDHALCCPPGRILAWNRAWLGLRKHVMRLVFRIRHMSVLDFRPHFFLDSKMSPRSVCCACGFSPDFASLILLPLLVA